jgi:hypothetical protein
LTGIDKNPGNRDKNKMGAPLIKLGDRQTKNIFATISKPAA